ncbi:MAG: hypothetical protein IKE52_05185 [Mogibacterium sp.]|nr:hypothetical protein [Mogibacterium sp.]
MLGKLLKYEIPSVGRKLGPLFIAWGVASAFLGISMRGFENGGFILVLSILLYIAVTVAIFVMMTILIIQRYSNSLLGDEAYFNLVLPVSINQHIANKTISAFVWSTISIIAAFVSGFIIFALSGGLREMIYSVDWAEFKEAMAMLGLSEASAVIEFIILSLLSSVKSILAIYAAITIGHQVRERVVLASIGAYIGLMAAESIIGNIFVGTSFFARITDEIPTIVDFHIIMVIGTVLSVGLSIGYFFICKYLMERRLNLS